MTDAVSAGIVDVAKFCEAKRFDPNVVLFIEGGTMQLFPIGLERLHCLTAWYGIDTHMDYDKHLLTSRAFDATFVAQKEYVERLRQDGVQQVFWLPLAADRRNCMAEDLPRSIDVAYVGSMQTNANPARHWALEALRRNFTNVYIGAATPERMNEIYQSAKVVFNRSVNNDINMRFFEAMSAGAVLVTDRIRNNGLEELFEPVRDLVEYADDAAAVTTIRQVLGDEGLRRKIGERAREVVCGRHTYHHRADELLKLVSSCEKLAKPSVPEYFAIFARMKLGDGMIWAARRGLEGCRTSWYSRIAMAIAQSLLALAYLQLRFMYAARGWFRRG
jgi:hypothetical protein